MSPYIIHLDEIQAKDVTLVGQKGSQLGQMKAADLPVPLGFCVTIDAYEKHIAASDLWTDIQKHLTDVQDPAKIERISTLVQNLVLQAPMPAPVRKAIETATRHLVQALGHPLTPLAVRPSVPLPGIPNKVSRSARHPVPCWAACAAVTRSSASNRSASSGNSRRFPTTRRIATTTIVPTPPVSKAVVIRSNRWRGRLS